MSEEIEEFDCDCKYNPICPHCGHENKDRELYMFWCDEDDDDSSCNKCGKDYEITIHVSHNFTTRKI